MAVPRLAGALVGTPVGIPYVAPLVSDVTIRLMFATLRCSFVLVHLRRIGAAIGYHGVDAGVRVYMVLVLLCRADHEIAIPTSVILMAFTSVAGIGTKLLTGSVQPGTFGNWLAAAPVPATLKHEMGLFRSSSKIFRDDDELFSEPSWIAVMEGQGIVLRQRLLTRAPWVPRRPATLAALPAFQVLRRRAAALVSLLAIAPGFALGQSADAAAERAHLGNELVQADAAHRIEQRIPDSHF